ncbi:CheR family methyltransferase [Devosia sp.]|uniref:CheR family methyltransferase n=1 Tax=Devosia sp. TaxID=1871048 RepID=UPI002FCAC617
MGSRVSDAAAGAHIDADELQWLLDAMYRRYGYDFRQYAPASLRRRVQRALNEEPELEDLAAYRTRILNDPSCMSRFLDIVSVETTAMFRDPSFYRALREKVIPQLRQQPRLSIWHAGCSTGEEVYSMAILLHEEGLLERTTLYATDINPAALQAGRDAIFRIRNMRQFTGNYQRAGGSASFADYYYAKHDGVIMRDFLRHNIVWADHNLVSDSSFNEFQLILCRNVMIYFQRVLQNRVHGTIYDSLGMHCVLGLGRGESLQFTPHEDCYGTVDRVEKLYRKVK